ncbi:hypothetical protein TNCV_4318411 [Trichonephila clavipes]|nr:hypothetical protein TNCV_4318411 [Trichonephila clavipes]
MTVLNRTTKTAMGIKWHVLLSESIWGDRPHNREPWSSDEDSTCAGTPPNYHISRRMFELSTDLTARHIRTQDIPATSLLP